MKNETYSGLLWSSRAGVMTQALNASATRDHGQGTVSAAFRPRKTKSANARPRLPGSFAAAALLLAGCAFGAALVVTLAA